jgi:hypothetical protein
MHFSFLICEVKCGIAGFDIADRQNAHSMTVIMKDLVEFFRGVRREQELYRQILGFSFLHDHESVRIWGHYPVINEDHVLALSNSQIRFHRTEGFREMGSVHLYEERL